MNIELKIYQANGSEFHGLSLKRPVVDSVVMSLGDKITGDVYYQDNSLAFTMREYVTYKGVNYVLVNPPTIVREGLVSDNGELKGMTKYSLTFYHPMYMLGNMPFSDIAVTSQETKYLSDSKTFSWVGKLPDFIAKLNSNLKNTEWVVVFDDGSPNQEATAKANKLSEVLSFDNSMISDALKTAYDTWELPFVIDSLNAGEYYDGSSTDYYTQGKRFVVVFGVPSNEIYQVDGQGQPTGNVFVFRFGQGVGLKNESRTPKENKIVTRLAGYGSEDNIPYGYPQVIWYGNQDWDYTINNDSTATGSYPIYKGIVNGQYMKLVKHPFTRTHLMPTVYSTALFNKVSPYAVRSLPSGTITANPNYNPDIELVDYVDADDANVYENVINPLAPSYEIHQFEDVKPELTEKAFVAVQPYDFGEEISYITYSEFQSAIGARIGLAKLSAEKEVLAEVRQRESVNYYVSVEQKDATFTYSYSISGDKNFNFVTYNSAAFQFKYTVLKQGVQAPTYVWNDTMNDDGEYEQSYFKVTLPTLGFDLYACASITQQMSISMRSGSCIGCEFEVGVDWDDYKKNFYNENGEFDPVIGTGHPRNGDKYPDSTNSQITLFLKKDINTFGTLKPNIYQQPASGDLFVILGISLPQIYVTGAEARLQSDMEEYLLENNVFYHDYPLKFDEYFLETHQGILNQIRNNTIVRFRYRNTDMALYVKQMTVKYGEKPLPEYNITLTDDVEVVLNKIGQVTEDVSRMRVQMSELQRYYGENVINEINAKLSRVSDDIAQGRITFQQGIDVLSSAFFEGDIQSPNFVSGMYTGRGWKVDSLGNAEFESARVRSVLEVIELLINRLQAQEGDTLFTDNDQIIDVELEQGGTYKLTLKEKWDGYYTAQQEGNIVKGIINTLAAKDAGVSDESDNDPEDQGSDDGGNKYYTSWMRVVATQSTVDSGLKKNQIRVVLYGDEDTPAQKNFAPCPLMNIARWGCALNPNEAGISEGEKQSRMRRQQLFLISSSDGRITKLSHVNTPKLRETNYGTTLGTLPEFVRNWSIANRLIDGRDYLYAQGVVVGDFIKVDIQGDPIVQYVDCGEWVNGQTYLVNEHNEETLQWETHDVWHNGVKWRCEQHQPVTSGGVSTYYEPKWGSQYWAFLEGDNQFSMDFTSSRGSRFREGNVSTTITPTLYWGNEDITNQIAASNWYWTRTSDVTNGERDAADAVWNSNHTGIKNLSLTNNDMPAWWSIDNRIKFTCHVTISDNNTLSFGI